MRLADVVKMIGELEEEFKRKITKLPDMAVSLVDAQRVLIDVAIEANANLSYEVQRLRNELNARIDDVRSEGNGNE